MNDNIPPPFAPKLTRSFSTYGIPDITEVHDYIMRGGEIPTNNVIRNGWPPLSNQIDNRFVFNNNQRQRLENITNIYSGLPHLRFRAKKKSVKKSVKKAKKSVKKAKKSVKKAKKSVKKAKKSVKKSNKKSVKKAKKSLRKQRV